MNLSLGMALDELEAYAPTAHFEASCDRNIEDVAVFGEVIVGTAVALVATTSDLSRLAATDGPAVIYIGDQVEIDAALPNWRGICIPGEANPSVVVQTLRSAQKRLDRWERDLLLAIASDADHQRILDIGARELRNPYVLCDTSSVLIAWAGERPPKLEGSVW